MQMRYLKSDPTYPEIEDQCINQSSQDMNPSAQTAGHLSEPAVFDNRAVSPDSQYSNLGPLPPRPRNCFSDS